MGSELKKEVCPPCTYANNICTKCGWNLAWDNGSVEAYLRKHHPELYVKELHGSASCGLIALESRFRFRASFAGINAETTFGTETPPIFR